MTRRAIKASQKLMISLVEWSLLAIVDLIDKNNGSVRSGELKGFLVNSSKNKEISSEKISKLTYDLKRSGYIRESKNSCVELTNKAKIKIIDKYSQKNKPDGKIRIVSFDIPEDMRIKRNRFRKILKNIGFKQIQKSLWACNSNQGELVEIAANDLGVSDYVAYFVVESSNINKHISSVLK